NDGVLDSDECNAPVIVLPEAITTTVRADWNTAVTAAGEFGNKEDFNSYADGTDVGVVGGFDFGDFTMEVTTTAATPKVNEISQGTTFGIAPLGDTSGNLVAFNVSTASTHTVSLTFDKPVIGFAVNVGDIHDSGTTTLNITYE
ncbi:hypothetical protein, partial [uncultured Polaribacter sp.]|uniref:hypothetical protein n=1 Tax=uncultured Polaribacter sp. TaxID=174711 RepID=UPI0026085895